jgi:hypothetical protein
MYFTPKGLIESETSQIFNTHNLPHIKKTNADVTGGKRN